MHYMVTFINGERAPVQLRSRSPEFHVGSAVRGDGKHRILFIRPDGTLEQPDPWVRELRAYKNAEQLAQIGGPQLTVIA